MKKVYDYHSGKLNESISLDKPSKRGARKLNESAFDDILDSRELHNEKEIANIINNNISGNGDPLVFWAYPGNDLLNTVQDICDDLNLACAVLSARDLMSTSIADINNVDVIIINELTRAQKPVFNEAYNDIIAKAEEGITVICTCRIDAAYNEMYAPDLLNFENYTYSPMYDRQSKFVDPEFDDEEEAYESVTEKFAKYRKLYESDEEKPAEDEDPFAGLGDLPGDEGTEDSEDKGEEEKEDSEDKGDDEGKEDEDEYVPMTAIVLTVAKDDADKCKDEMVEAGIDADAIEILDGEEDDENAKIRVDADYAKELKDYLSGKGIDLEEKIGGEIVDDSEEGEEEEKKDDEESKDDEENKDDDENMSFDDEFGDLFGDDEESSDEA